MLHLEIQPARTTSALQGAATPGGLEEEGYTVEDGYVVVETQAEADELLDRYSNLELDLSRGAEHEPDADAKPNADATEGVGRTTITEEGVEQPGGDTDDGVSGDEPEAEKPASGFDADAWLDQDYSDRADAVRAGEVDDHLDAIAEAERSETVLEAVADRREEL